MPEAYTHIRIARAALAQSGEHAPSTAAYEMGANGPDPLFAYRVLSAKRPCRNWAAACTTNNAAGSCAQ